MADNESVPDADDQVELFELEQDEDHELDRATFLNERGELRHFFELPGTRFCGGQPPLWASALHALQRRGVGLIVTLLQEPLHPGLVRNPLPARAFHPGFPRFASVSFGPDVRPRSTCVRGEDMSEEQFARLLVQLRLETLHLPVEDGSPPSSCAAFEQCVQQVRAFRLRRPHDKIYVHCWAGGGRTTVVLVLLLMAVHGVACSLAMNCVQGANRRACRTTATQRAFLQQLLLEEAPFRHEATDSVVGSAGPPSQTS